MQPIMVTVPVWLLIVLGVVVAAVSGSIFWAVGRFLFRKNPVTPTKGEQEEKKLPQDNLPPKSADPKASTPRAPSGVSSAVSQPVVNSKKEEGITMMTQQESQKLRDQLSGATGRLNRAAEALEARNKTITELRGQIAEKDTVIGQKDARIVELERQLKAFTDQSQETGKAVSKDAADLDQAGSRLDAAMQEPATT